MGGLTLKPILGCNFSCTGCYEGEIFKLNSNAPEAYNLDALIDRIKNDPRPGPATLHGGEILLMPVSDLRKLCEAAKEANRPIQMQTNGSLITDRLLELLVEYQVNLGFSLNGPGILNRDRQVLNANINITDKTTDRIHKNIERLRTQKIRVGIITVLSMTNVGTDVNLQTMIGWASDFGKRLNIWDWRWNPLFMNVEKDCVSEAENTELSSERLSEVYIRLAEATFADRRRMWNPFREFVDNLWGLGIQPCEYSPCDVYNTDAVYAVFNDGSVGNCLRTASDGINYLRDEKKIHTRQEILKQIPMKDGGCGGCRYWSICNGGCPACGEDGDWRNKTRFCKPIIDVYKYIEDRLQGLIPNFTPRPDWTCDDESRLQQSISNRNPEVCPINPVMPGWSVKASTYMHEARKPIT